MGALDHTQHSTSTFISSSSASIGHPLLLVCSGSWSRRGEEWWMEREEEAVCEEERGEGEGKEMTMIGEKEVEGVRVLVVDDSLVDRKVMERLLLRSDFKFEVSTVDSGRKAMEVLGLNGEKTESHTLDGGNFDIVLTDYCMPEMDGYELLTAIKENASSKSIPVVVVSSENDSQRISSCIANGAEDFIIKPLQTEHLQRLVNYARPQPTPAPKSGNKRKLPLEVVAESNGSPGRPRLASVAVA